MKAILLAVAIFAHSQGGTVVSHHPFALRPQQQIVTVDVPIVFHPSELVGQEQIVLLAWHTRWWDSLKQQAVPGVSFKTLRMSLAAPEGYAFAGPPQLDGSETHS